MGSCGLESLGVNAILGRPRDRPTQMSPMSTPPHTSTLWPKMPQYLIVMNLWLDVPDFLKSLFMYASNLRGVRSALGEASNPEYF